MTGFLLGPGGAFARLPEPDHTVYGALRFNGQPVTTGLVTVKVNGDPQPIAAYEMGSDPNVGQRYVLRIPLDSVEPRRDGSARPGDQAQFFLDGVLAGHAVVGERGTVQNIDLDPTSAGAPTLSIGDVSVYEGNSGFTNLNFTVTLSQAIGSDVTFNVATADGTAQGGIDYVEIPAGTPGKVLAGNTTATVTVQVNGETFQENDETLLVNISSVSGNAVLVDGQAVGTILDDDRPPSITIDDVAVVEGDSGTSDAVFQLHLSRPVAGLVTANYQTADQSAAAGSDYDSAVGLASFAPSTTTTTVTVHVHGDDVDENDETFLLNLTNPTGGSVIGDAQAVGTILDDDGFLTFVESDSLATIHNGAYGGSSVAVSPDGAHVYATGRVDDGIAVFTRDPATGALTFLEALRDGDVQAPNTIAGLNGAESVVVSPDGAHVYVASFNDNSVVVFSRETDSNSPAYGRLTWVEAKFDTVSGSPNGLGGATAVALSPDGDSVYVAGENDDAIAVFSRNTDSNSPDFGKLTYVQMKKDGTADGVLTINGLNGVKGLQVSPDGKHVYAAGAADNAVAVFSRNNGTGALTYVQAQVDGVGGANGLEGASSVALSPDGAYLYATGQLEDAVAVFSRNDVNGALTFVELQKDGVNGVDGLDGATSVRVSFDSRFVYVAGFFDDAIAAFHRDTTNGRLTFLEMQKDGFGVNDGLARVAQLAVSPDDQNVYGIGQVDDAIGVYTRDATAPANPTTLISTSHTVGAWSNDTTIDVQWAGASDNAGGSGLAGYSYLFDTAALTLPNTSVDKPHTVDPHTATSSALPNGNSFYFHLRTCDTVGNCALALHLGPFYIDTAAPTNPPSLISDHVANVASNNPIIGMNWSAATDPLSGLDGYAVAFDHNSGAVCDQTKDIEEGATSIASASLADGTWYFHLCARDNAGNWSAPMTGGPYIIEAHPPLVLSVDSVAGTGDGVLGEGEDTFASITQLLVNFSEAMTNPANDNSAVDVTNPASYRMLVASFNGTFPVGDCSTVFPDSNTLSVDSVTYDAVNNRAAVRINGGLPLPAGKYRLLACQAGLHDLPGNSLDGNGNGTGGDDFQRTFTVDVSNLLKNPNFDANVNIWTKVPGSPVVITHAPAVDSDGAASSGSAAVAYNATVPVAALSQCVLVQANTGYELDARARLTSPVNDAPAVYGQVLYYQTNNCSTELLSQVVTDTILVGGSGGNWVDFSGFLPSPLDAHSAKVQLVVETLTAGSFTVNLDNASFYATTVVFKGGFESGFSGWQVYP